LPLSQRGYKENNAFFLFLSVKSVCLQFIAVGISLANHIIAPDDATYNFVAAGKQYGVFHQEENEDSGL
jgi:hypothetical protein